MGPFPLTLNPFNSWVIHRRYFLSIEKWDYKKNINLQRWSEIVIIQNLCRWHRVSEEKPYEYRSSSTSHYPAETYTSVLLPCMHHQLQCDHTHVQSSARSGTFQSCLLQMSMTLPGSSGFSIINK